MADPENFEPEAPSDDKNPPVPLFLFFWLPAGKDAFGFQGRESASLNVLSAFQAGVYRPIGIHFAERYNSLIAEQYNSLKGIKNFKFTGPNSNLQIEEGNKLNLRKVSCDFVYTPSGKLSFASKAEIKGRFSLYSSGLYVWRFDIHVTKSEDPNSNEKSKKKIKNFIEKHFIEDVMVPLFDFKWVKSLAQVDSTGHMVLTRSDTADRAYKGALNYYQMELLYDYIFDTELMPQVFFRNSYDNSKLFDIDNINKKFSIEHIINSLCLISWRKEKRDYFPLVALKSTFFLKDEDDNLSYLRPEEFIYPKKAIGSGASVDDRDSFLLEQFYARMSYAAMEQFICVANTFGLSSCHEGLEAARKIILLNNFRSKEFKRECRSTSIIQRVQCKPKIGKCKHDENCLNLKLR